MTAVEKAAQVYKQERCGSTFRDDLEAHLLHGFVFSRPDFFVMVRPVVSTADRNDIIDPWVQHHSECDCWHLFLFAGNMARAWAFLPWEMPLMSFEKRNVLRFYRLEALKVRTLL